MIIISTTRIIPIHKNKGKSILKTIADTTNYAMNPDKTENKQLVSSYACNPETVETEFALSKREYYEQTGRINQSDIIAYWGDSSKIYYAYDYYNSSIREWLTNDFYATAFSESQQKKMQKYDCDNSCSNSSYGSKNSSDKVFLLSYDEVKNSAYGFDADPTTDDIARMKQGTDYAKCQGLYVESSGSEYDGNSWWWLRSSGFYSHLAFNVDIGFTATCNVTNFVLGVCPALKLNLESLSAQLTIDIRQKKLAKKVRRKADT